MIDDDRRIIEQFERNARPVEKANYIMQMQMLEALKKMNWALGRIDRKMEKLIEITTKNEEEVI